MVPKPSPPRLSTYRPLSSSSGHSIRASISDTKFPHVPRSRRRRRPRSSSTSNGNDISLSSTHDSDEDTNLRPSEHQVDSSPEPLRPQPIVPLRVPLMRLSDPAPILQDSRVFHASSPSEDGPLLTYSSLPPTPIPSSPPPSTSKAERYRLPQKQSDVYTPPFSLWDYLREELLVTDFDSHQELKWERVSNFLSIPVAIEKVSAFGTVHSNCPFNHPKRSYHSGSYSASTHSCTHSRYSLYVSPLLSGDSLSTPSPVLKRLYRPPRKPTF
jgi:hypothetical protein